MKKAMDLMTRQVASVRANDSAAAASRLMWECDCGVVPVLDTEDRVIAMVTDRDICMAATIQDRAPSAIRLTEVMSRELHACSPDDTLAYAEKLMRARQVRRLPVLDEQRRLVGILSLADIVRASPRDRAANSELMPEQVTAMLADICASRNGAPATR